MMQKIKIVHLTASPCYGGPERQMLELGKELSQFGRSVYVSFLEEGRCHEFIREAKRQGFAAQALKRDTPRLLAAVRELKALLRSERAELLCCHGYKANLLGLLAARRIGIPVISVSRGWTGESLRVRIFEAIDRRILRWMDKVVCVSEAQAQKVYRGGVHEDNIVIIHNAIRPERFENSDPVYREQLRRMFPNPPQLIVGAAGRLSPEKGFDVLIDAAAEVCTSQVEVGFVLFGDGPLREELQRQIQLLGLDGRFILAGFRADLDRLLPHFDLMVLPSFTEGLPNVVLEAFAAGIPVVATAVGGTPEIVEDGVSGYLTPAGDGKALSRQIVCLLVDDTRRRQMGEAGRQYVLKRFSFTVQAETYQQLFVNLIRDHTPGSSQKQVASLKLHDKTSPRSMPVQTRPLRVCFLIDNLNRAGTESQLLMLIRGLDRKRFEPYLCLLDGTCEASQTLEPDNCPIIRLGVSSFFRLSLFVKLWRFVRILRREKIDILQLHFRDSTYFGVLAGKLAGMKRIVLTRRNIGHWMQPLDRFLMQICQRFTHATIANCEACRQSAIAQERARPERVHVIPNGIDLSRFGISRPTSPR